MIGASFKEVHLNELKTNHIHVGRELTQTVKTILLINADALIQYNRRITSEKSLRNLK